MKISKNEEQKREKKKEKIYKDFLTNFYMGEEKGKDDLIVISKNTVFIVCALIVGICIGYLIYNFLNQTGKVELTKPSTNVLSKLSKEEIDSIKEKVKNYIDENFLSAYGVKSNIKNYTEYENIIEFVVEVNFSGQTSTTNVYTTKDGKYLILGSMLDMSKPLPKLQQTGEERKSNDYGKVERPKVLLFVMSFCPYGQQAERGIFPVIQLLKDKFDFELHFVIYPSEYYNNDSNYCMEGLCSMHGVSELKEDIRQMCVIKYYPEKWIEYITEINNNCNYKNVESCWEGIAEKVGINASKIKECASSEGIQMAKEDLELNKKYDVAGSPTMFINDVEYIGGRSP
ncbi:MAG: hypothetical protein QXI58_02865, partial [Candidatus Micrarchaeia archaeon]